MDEKKIYLVDGHSLLFKAYFGIRGLTNPQGMPVNAIFGFAQTINRIIEEIKPEFLCVCFDLPGKTFRNDIYPDYKAHRPPTPEDLDIQTPHAKRFVVVRGVRTAEKQNFESDDVMVTLARRAAARGFHAYILSSDKDLLQAIAPGITIVRMTKNNFEFINREEVIQSYGVPPEMIPDFQGLVGDSSDNIPGVPGIGEKTAPKLLAGFKSLEEMFAHLDQIPNPKHRDKLREKVDKALLSKRLAVLR
ncbi:MAG: hypothetical protein NTX50_11090, partial [Candidatus Sumerlaeota bacterium]|nr:hypothetical protein [Candidatus Sumerlaeota bacterium]